ncbi:YqzE family protein [Oceanobacillus saliphilus]|uniref:YqzE family protein n=1 Tax=Oceanobacillus saliphilus TaxID=2925834 RepID=UPI00201E4C13|nr:YqzE family protein [Oceanobacillus saliphilus]
MSGNDYLKFMTEQVITYMNLPTEEKKKRKSEKKHKPIFMNRWLGMLPFTIKVMFQKRLGHN